MKETNNNARQNPIYTSIVVLDDGETWASNGKVIYLTANGYQRLLDGAEIRDLAGSDIVKQQRI
jgi:hypothetical protein